MDVLPAIDLRGGKVVRLQQGNYDQQTTYADDPVAVAKGFIDTGTKWIHVVDLDAARTGRLINTESVREICQVASPAGVNVQNGGGIRDLQVIQTLLNAGISRLVIGSAALKNWGWFEQLLGGDEVDNERLALGLDARGGLVAAEGWTEQLDQLAVDLARRVSGSGLGAIVYTDIERDSMLTGVNVEATAELVAATDVPVVASGGLSSLDDIRQCHQIGCSGVILGKALYEGQVDLGDALDVAGK
ncbi:MAG TPA: 1-(5-phosphoribosyl)-5-[(5-phosphoribosylamino)methylideneamino]imidazole-4-carboxamide isomerase [Phycisphaerae bacterium]|nr:1-(5-phosphoribosyl)-5-[(5-phosphoribosylamino)methylideneamino]imidazole-4-carboxamide isomerase [Phycisphaerae bacterium]